MYIAQWGIFIEGEDLDPVDVARQAREKFLDPNNDMWQIIDMETGTTWAVEPNGRGVVPPASESHKAAS